MKAVQNVADSLLDPDKVDFQTVMKLVAANRTLPGIQDVNDQVAERIEPKASSVARPLKPWEKKKAAEGDGAGESSKATSPPTA